MQSPIHQFILTREKFRMLPRINWMKLFILGALITTVDVVFQTFTLPFALNKLFHSPPLADSSSTLSDVERILVSPVISSNSSNRTIGSAQGQKNKATKSQRPRRNWKIINWEEYPETPVPSPVPFTPLQHGNGVNCGYYVFQRYVLSLPPDEALKYAKKEIEHPPSDTDDPVLHAPVFLNISIFKRSYELMELILKVFIYPDGKRPLCHDPYLSGIYASEGWFMKLMEMNKHFATGEPQKAHLFYLPYSVRQLQLHLYGSANHDIKPLKIFVRDYTNMIISKYPFWNRTGGVDHFVVACHDWGPHTLSMHKGLNTSAIKALCNADISEGIFKAGRDISLPETTIKYPARPHRTVGHGNKVSKRTILAFFAGHVHGRVRPRLLKYWRNKDDDMRVYALLPRRVSQNMSYIHHMKTSKFCLCPMGHEVNSPRIVESIYYECVPVIIADDFALPFGEVLNWTAFSVVVPEKDIPKLKEILLAIPLRRYQIMHNNVKMVQKHFLWNPRPKRYDLFHMILHSIWFSRVRNIQIPNPSYQF